MDNTIIAAFIGVLGTIIATAAGGYCAYRGSKDAYVRQMKDERDKREIEELERMTTTSAIIKTFLLPELKRNYNCIKNVDVEQRTRNLLKGELENTGRQIGNFTFYHANYDTIKYDIIKYNIKEMIDVIDVYQTFTFIEENGNKVYDELNDNEKDLLKKGITKCEELIKNS